MARHSVRSRLIRSVPAALLALAALPATSAPAAAQPDPNPTASYLISIELKRDGTAHVTESVDLTVDGSVPVTDFGVPYARPVGGHRYQLTPVRNLHVRPTAGTPTPEVTDDGTRMTITTRHPTANPRPGMYADSFEVAFDLDHAVTTSGGTVRFAWDPIGTSEDGVRDVSVSLGAPGGVRAASCGLDDERGHLDPCPRPKVGRYGTTYDVPRLPTARGLTVRADLPPGSVAAAKPDYTTFGDPDAGPAHRSPRPAPPALAAMAVLLALALAVPWYARRRVRPAAHATAEPGLPDDMTPAMASLIGGFTRDRRRATGISVAVTLIDLARRGHVSVESVDGGADWRIIRMPPGGSAPAPAPYETRLLDDVFTTADEVLLSRLRGRYDVAQRLRAGLRRDAREHGWLTDALVVAFAAAVPIVLTLVAVDIAADRLVTGWPFVAAGLVVLAASVARFVLPLCRLTGAGRVAERRVRAARDASAAGFGRADPDRTAAYDLAYGLPTDAGSFGEQVTEAFRPPSGTADPAGALHRLEDRLAETTSGDR